MTEVDPGEHLWTPPASELQAHSPASTALVGRDREIRAILDQLPRRSREGTGAILVTGAAGVGKTALLDTVEMRAFDCDIVRTDGAAAESTWAYAGLNAVISRYLSHANELSPRDRRLLGVVQSLDHTDIVPPQRVAAVMLALLRTAADHTPWAWLIDDAQHLDEESRQVIGFVCGRLRGVAGLVVVTTDDSQRGVELAGPNSRHLQLTNLPERLAVELLLRRTDGRIVAPVASRVAMATDGNPLLLHETTRRMTREQLRGLRRADDLLPTTPRTIAAFAPQWSQLPSDARFAVLMVALEPGLPLEVMQRHDVSATASAADAGVLRVSDGRCRVANRTLSALALGSTDSLMRQRAHRLLEGVLESHDPTRALLHRAAARGGPDNELAERLCEVASRLVRHGDGSQATDFARQGRRLATERLLRGRLALESAGAALLEGYVSDAVRHLDGGLLTEPEAGLRADLVAAKALLMFLKRGVVPNEFIRREAERLSAVEPIRAVALYEQAARHQGALLDLEARAASLRRAHALVRQTGAAAPAPGACTEPPPHAPDDVFSSLELARAYTLCRQERWVDAREELETKEQQGRLRGIPLMVIHLAFLRTIIELSVGNVTAARAAAEEATRSQETSTHLAIRLTTLARIRTIQGDFDDAAEYIQRAQATSGHASSLWRSAAIPGARGFLALMRGAYAEAASHLTLAHEESVRLPDPSLLKVEGDFIEASLRAGDRERAQAALALLETRVGQSPTFWGWAVLGRSQAILADEASYQATFKSAIAAASRPEVSPLERARTEFCYAERLHKAGRRVSARAHLRLALHRFEGCGAHAWVEITRTRLRWTAEDGTPAPAPSAALTARETEIVRLVISGATNRDIARALFISVRTVENHLGSAYRKRGVRSRSQLRQVMSPPDAEPVSGPEDRPSTVAVPAVPAIPAVVVEIPAAQ